MKRTILFLSFILLLGAGCNKAEELPLAPAGGPTGPTEQPIAEPGDTPRPNVTKTTSMLSGKFTFLGKFRIKPKNDDLSFTLDISERTEMGEDGVERRIIEGYHCAVTQNANRIDCALESDGAGFSVNGVVADDDPSMAVLTITSHYGESVAIIGTLKADDRDPNKVHWEITGAGEGEHYIPEKATITRG